MSSESRIGLWAFLCLMVLTTSMVSCGQPQIPEADGTDRIYRTSDPSRLYFKNIRSASYSKQAGPGRGIDVYTLRAFGVESASPQIIPRIIDFWLDDKAYLHLQKNNAELFADTLNVAWTHADSSGTMRLEISDNDAQYNFASQLYKKAVNRADMQVELADGNFAPILDREPYRSAFITTLRDYYRLTDVSISSMY